MMRTLFLDLALANEYNNAQWLTVMSDLPFDVLAEDQGGFFKSIFGTWNHILLGDRIWLGRIFDRPFPIQTLHDQPCADWPSFVAERATTDQEFIDFVRSESDFERTISYQTTSGAPNEERLHRILNHVFAHQNHHRGQISQMCHRLNIATPDGGMIDYFRRPAE